MEDHIKNVKEFLHRCRLNGITLNKKKSKIAESEVFYAGYKINTEGIEADQSKVKAIQEYPEPKNITELRSFLGLVNQLGNFSSNISSHTSELRGLLSGKNKFNWLPEHTSAFNDIKKVLCEPPILHHFDPTLPVILQTDASRTKGIGFALLQETENGCKLIQCGSRFLGDAETRYATIELELLGIVWAVKKCYMYLKGLDQFTIEMDHRPLITILDKKCMNEIENPRILRLKEKLSGMVFTTKWVPGKKHLIADAFSRSPVDYPDTSDEELEKTLSIRSNLILEEVQEDKKSEDKILENLRRIAKNDPEYQDLIRNVKKGFPKNIDNLIPSSRLYWNVRHLLSIENDLIYMDMRVVIPKEERKNVLSQLHASHQGLEKSKRRARESVFWPGINSDIANTVNACNSCQELRPSNKKEEMKIEEPPERIFQKVSADFFSVAGRDFLVIVDRLSNWPVIFNYEKGQTKTRSLIHSFRKYFADVGIPEVLRTDGGPQFASREFRLFLEKFGVTHEMSTPYYP